MKRKIVNIILLAGFLAIVLLAFLVAKITFPFIEFSDYDKINIATVSANDISRHIWATQNSIDIDSIRISVIPDFKKESLLCVENIRGRKKADKKIILNLSDNAEIECLKLNGKQKDFLHINNHIIINNNDKDFSLKIKYRTKPEGGIYFANNENGEYLYTINEPIFASEWLACNDKPDDKFYFSLSALVDNRFAVISNGKKTGEKKYGLKKKIFWESSYPISSYLTALYVGRYNVAEKIHKGIAIEIYYFPNEKNADEILKLSQNAIDVFSGIFCEYPFKEDKLGIVETNWNYGGMENQTAICIGEKFFDANYFKQIIVHEISHEWFGNCVTISDWDDVWINEGLATFCEAIFEESEGGESSYEATVNSFRDFSEDEKLSNRERFVFSKSFYHKSAIVFYKLRKKYGDGNFFKKINNYLCEHKYSSVNSDSLKKYFKF